MRRWAMPRSLLRKWRRLAATSRRRRRQSRRRRWLWPDSTFLRNAGEMGKRRRGRGRTRIARRTRRSYCSRDSWPSPSDVSPRPTNCASSASKSSHGHILLSLNNFFFSDLKLLYSGGNISNRCVGLRWVSHPFYFYCFKCRTVFSSFIYFSNIKIVMNI